MKEALAIMAVAVCAILSLLLNAINFVLLLAVLAGVRGLRTLLLDARGKEEAMGNQQEDLLTAVRGLAQAEGEMESRIDAIILALKEPHDSPLVAQAISELEELRVRVGKVDDIPDSQVDAADEAGGEVAPAGSGDMGAS